MNKIYTVLFLISFIFSNIDAITKDGKPVVLKSDGTWEFISTNKNIDPEDFGIWEIGYFVDDFGDPTSEGYIKNSRYIKGTFSNSATTNADLNVKFIIYNDGRISIKLYEYGRNHAVSGKISTKTYKIQIKHNGVVVKTGKKKNKDFSGENSYERVRVEPKEELIDILSSGGEVKFKIIETGTYSNSSYSFKIDDVSGFSNVYKKLTESIQN